MQLISAKIMLLVCLLPALASSQPPQLQARFDPRMDLISVLCRLAQFEEYSQGSSAWMLEDADRHFQPFNDHRAVQMLQELRSRSGIGFDAPMSLAVHVTEPPTLALRPAAFDTGTRLDARWTRTSAEEFLSAARDFCEVSKFMEFWSKQQASMDKVAQDFNTCLSSYSIPEWSRDFFGTAQDTEFHLILSLMNGPASYGPSYSNGEEQNEFYSVYGLTTESFAPGPSFTTQHVLTVTHEFSHSFINPLTARHRVALEPAASRLYPFVHETLQKQAYGTWETMVNESLVRAAVIQYSTTLQDGPLLNYPHFGLERCLRQANRFGFTWTGDLVDRMDGYVVGSAGGFEAFLKEIIAVLEICADDYVGCLDRNKDRVQRLLELRKVEEPQIVATYPEHLSTDVDFHIEEIRIRFDRAMDPRYHELRKSSAGDFPSIKDGIVGFRDEEQEFFIKVQLMPGTTYSVALNRPLGGAFRDLDGHQLLEKPLTFTTRVVSASEKR